MVMDYADTTILLVSYYYCYVISVLGTLACSLAVVTIVTSKTLNSGMKIVLCNSFITPLVFAACIMPFMAQFFAPSTAAKCADKLRFPGVFFAFVCALSLLELLNFAQVAFYRFLAISSIVWYAKWTSVQRTSVFCVLNFAVSIIIWGLIWGLRVIRYDRYSCVFSSRHILLTGLLIAMIFGIPLALTITFLTLTQYKIRQHNKKSHEMRSSTHEIKITVVTTNETTPENNSISHLLTEPASPTSEGRRESRDGGKNPFHFRSLLSRRNFESFRLSPGKRNAKHFLNTTRKLWIILFTYCLTNIPFIFAHVVIQRRYLLFVGLHLFHWIHLVIDPLIYLILNKKDLIKVNKNIKLLCCRKEG